MDVYALNSYRNTTVQEANINCLERGAHSKPLRFDKRLITFCKNIFPQNKWEQLNCVSTKTNLALISHEH